MKILQIALPSLAVCAAGLLLFPASSDGYTLIGGSLSQYQRDFRVFNNFTAATANNNLVPDANFPGYQGAVMAIWKASVEWGSELHGDGNGDPHQPYGLGSGGGNFDTSFQAEALVIGTTNGNIHSEITGSSGGVLAYTETPISDGWRIRYYEGWSWADGPGTAVSGIDLQGVACHEYGHAIGIGHTTTGGATMYPTISGTGVVQRSIEPDDKAAVQAIYGVKAATKPHIDSILLNGASLVVRGAGFSPTSNEVWFTQAAAGGLGVPIKVTGLASNGTDLSCTIPATAGSGDIEVRNNSTAHAGLSNAFPIDLLGGGTGTAPTVSSVSPSAIEAVVIDGPGLVTLVGSGFTGTSSVVVDGIPLLTFPAQFSVQDDSTLVLSMPLVSKLGPVAIDVTAPGGSVTTSIDVVANATPTVDMLFSDPGFLFQGVGLQLTIGSHPGDILFVEASSALLPSVLPGIVDLAIGNNFTSLFLLASPTIPAEGYKALNIPMSGLASGTKIHVQAAGLILANFYSLPATVSNVQTGTVLF